MHQKLFFQACFHNYFVSVPRWNVIYSSAIKLFFFSFFPLPVPGGIKKKTTTQSHSLKKETTCSPLSFIGRCLLVCDITSVPHFFSLRNRPSIRNCEEKIYNSRKYIFQPKFYFFYFFFHNHSLPQEEISVEPSFSLYSKPGVVGILLFDNRRNFAQSLQVLYKRVKPC